MKSTSDLELTGDAAGGLAALKQRLEFWRAGRKAGERIPAGLWADAVAAVAQHGIYRVAIELRLDYAALKRRAGMATGPRSGTTSQPAVAARFVEMFAPAAAASLPMSRPDCVVELANSRGASMRLELNGNALSSLPALCAAFCAA
jgi:hypothetical protein